jgi:hypothetical protein
VKSTGEGQVSTSAQSQNARPEERQLLRHTLATLAYRGGKAIRGMPAQAAVFRAGEGSRTPSELLAHIGDLLDWALSLAKGAQKWQNSTPLDWDKEVTRFYAALQALDNYLASSEPLHAPVERLFQGPVADALTHVGQIAVLRRLAGSPIKGENYFVAEIVAGKVSEDQAQPKREF